MDERRSIGEIVMALGHLSGGGAQHEDGCRGMRRRRAFRVFTAVCLLLLASVAGCQVMITDLADRGEVVLDCSVAGAVPARAGFQCLQGEASRAPAYFGASVEALWGPWNAAPYGFCVSFAPDGTGVARERAGGGQPRVDAIRWGVIVDEYGWVERTPAGHWPVYIESSLAAVPDVLFWRPTVRGFARRPLLGPGACRL